MEYSESKDGLNVETNILDGNVTLDEAVEFISLLTKIDKTILKEGAIKHSFIEIMENPSLIEISKEEEEMINDLRYTLDYKVGVAE